MRRIGTLSGKQIGRDFARFKYAYLMALPVLAFYLVFHYWPMYGALIAFKDFTPAKGIWGSEWVGFEHFVSFFKSFYFFRVIKNTLTISLTQLLFGFPAPVLLALLINEISSSRRKRIVQTITYLPYFVSLVVICGLIVEFSQTDGLFNWIRGLFGLSPVALLNAPRFFVPVFVASGVWQNIGWNSIIYLSAMSAINPELYEAAIVDGAGRFRQALNITLPGVAPTIIVLLILRVGQIMNVGFEKVLLLYNNAVMDVADVISTYVYRKGLLEFNWSFSAAVGLFNSCINFILLVLVNKFARKITETSLW
jgi:putative aldouronate transport system permease protein